MECADEVRERKAAARIFMSIAPLTFSGISTYSQDFQTVLDRAVRIASLPLTALQNENLDVLTRQSQLASLGGSVSSVTTALQSLARVSEQKALTATSSNTAVVSVSNAGAVSSAVYTIDSVTSLAKAASETTATGYADSSAAQVSASGTVKLIVGSEEYTINLTPETNNLNGLRTAINALGAGVTASVLTTGTGPTPNYLSISAANTGATTLRLVEDPSGAATDLLTSANQGSNAEFSLNGLSVIRKTNQVNDVIPGLTFSLLDESATPVTLSLSTQKGTLIDSLNSFVSAYNQLSSAIQGQVGEAAGLLSGDFLVREIQKAQRELSGYSSNGLTLGDLGIRFDSTGQATLDTSVVSNFTDTQLSSAFTFLGNKSAGFGSLQNRFAQISDPVTGLVKLQQDSYERTDIRLQRQISELEERISNLQTSTAARLQQVDALLGLLESQKTLIDASVKSVNLTLYGKSTE